MTGLDWTDWTNWIGWTDRADMADIADMADRANSKVIFPTIAYIDGKSEIISDSLTHSLTDSTNCKEMLSHLKMTRCLPTFSKWTSLHSDISDEKV